MRIVFQKNACKCSPFFSFFTIFANYSQKIDKNQILCQKIETDLLQK